MYSRVIVPLDGSVTAERALDQAAELAKVTGAPLHLVRVVDITRLERYGAYGLALEYAGLAEVASEEERAAREYLDETAASLAGKGVEVTTEIGRGLVVQVLGDIAQPTDVIVMASHGRTGLSRWFLGSVAEDVVRRSSCPVLIVRAAGGNAETDELP